MYLLEDLEEISGWYSSQHLFYQFVCEICPSTDVGDEQGQEETVRNVTCVPTIVKEQTVFTYILQKWDSFPALRGKRVGARKT